MRELLQNETENSFQKFIAKCDRGLLQSASGITKCDRSLLQSALGITECDKLLLQSASCDSYYKAIRNRGKVGQYVKWYFRILLSSLKYVIEVTITWYIKLESLT